MQTFFANTRQVAPCPRWRQGLAHRGRTDEKKKRSYSDRKPCRKTRWRHASNSTHGSRCHKTGPRFSLSNTLPLPYLSSNKKNRRSRAREQLKTQRGTTYQGRIEAQGEAEDGSVRSALQWLPVKLNQLFTVSQATPSAMGGSGRGV